MAGVEIEVFPSEDKWSPTTTHVSRDGAPLTGTIKSMSLETFNPGSPDAAHQVKIAIEGNSDSQREANAKNVRTLLEDAGFKGISVETLGSQTRLTIAKVDGNNPLISVAHSLARDLEGAHGATNYAALDDKTVAAIEKHHMETHGLKSSEAGLVEVETHMRDAEWHKMRGVHVQQVATVDAHIPRGPVASIREDVSAAGAAGHALFETRSNITLRDWGQQNQVVEALRSQGMHAEVVHHSGVAYVQSNGTADQVAHALESKKLLPPHIAQEIEQHALDAHPKAGAINEAITLEAKERKAGWAETMKPGEAVKLPEGHLPEVHAPKVGHVKGGGALGILVGAGVVATLAAANGASAAEVGAAATRGAQDAALPGMGDGFSAAKGSNASLDTWFARADLATGGAAIAAEGVAVGAAGVAGGATLLAPVTAGTSLAVTAGALTTAAGAQVVAVGAGVANIGVSLAHDVAHVTGHTKEGGIITSMVSAGAALLDSKAAHAVGNVVHTEVAKHHTEMAIIAHDAAAGAKLGAHLPGGAAVGAAMGTAAGVVHAVGHDAHAALQHLVKDAAQALTHNHVIADAEHAFGNALSHMGIGQPNGKGVGR